MGPLSLASIGLQAGESKSDQCDEIDKCDGRIKKDRAGCPVGIMSGGSAY
jgi:hypothetical protein